MLIGKRSTDQLPRASVLAKKFNRAQGKTLLFEFVGLSDEIIIRDRFPATYHSHENETYFAHLKKVRDIAGSNVAGVVGITLDILREDRFNVHDAPQRIGIVTLNDMEEACPKRMATDQYLLYLTLCEAFCVVAKTQFETNDELGCLFDRCDDKAQLKQCLKQPIIHPSNQPLLFDAGYEPFHIAIANALLKDYVGKSRLIYWLSESTWKFVIGLGLSSAIHTVFHLIEHPEKRVWWGVFAISLFFFFLPILIIFLRRGRIELPTGH